MMTNEMHYTTSAIIMILSLSLSIILGAVIFLSSIENNNGSIIYAQFQNNNSNISLGVNITSPQRGQQIPISTSSLNISGKSTDNPTADDCQVSVIVNDVKPYQPATANGNIGAKNDYSKWFFDLGSNYTSINEGTNEITAKLSCLSNSLNNNNNGLNNNNNATKWYSINVTGVITTNNITVPTQSSPVINSTQNEPNTDESQNPDEEQEELLVDTTDKNAENVMKEEIRNFRERIMDEVEQRLKEQGIELNLP